MNDRPKAEFKLDLGPEGPIDSATIIQALQVALASVLDAASYFSVCRSLGLDPMQGDVGFDEEEGHFDLAPDLDPEELS